MASSDQLQRALTAIEKLQARLEAVERERNEPIAIIGFDCRFPGASSWREFHTLLEQGRDATGPAPADRHHYVEGFRAGFVPGIELFDAAFFGITPREAAAMDPQQRLALELAWTALESAGLAPDQLFGTNTGVYLGACSMDFPLWRARHAAPESLDAYFATGASLGVAAGRISYFLGLTGPAMTIDTACSSSLVAVHQACAALRNRECSMALAGGVSLLLAPEYATGFTRANMLSPDGRSKAFDAAADGFARAEGCGMVVLKRLGRALSDGDRIRAIIRGSAVNQDGASGGLTVPSGPSQEEVIRRALDAASLSPHDIDYIEAHGTGTLLGDPIEIGALNEVFAGRPRPLTVASVKTNLGHTEAAAGIAGLIKTVLAIEAGRIPAHLHFRRANPHLDLARLPIRIPSQPSPWNPAPGHPRRAGVSAFGFSGTNAHVILEQAPAQSQPTSGAGIFVLSAATPASLQALARAWAEWIAQTQPDLASLCAFSLRARAHLACRFALVPRDAAHLAQALRTLASDSSHDLCRLYLDGEDLPYIELAPDPYPRLDAPGYAFDRARHWLTREAEPSSLAATEDLAALLTAHRQPAVADWVALQIADITGLAAAIDRRRGFTELGMDSLMAADLLERVERHLGRELPITAVFNHASVEDFSRYLVTEWGGAQ